MSAAAGAVAPDGRQALPLPLGSPRPWWALLAILALSLTLRLAFYTGFYGSDEVTYLSAAVKVLHGDWSAGNYIGALRYGFQLPIAGFMYLFGQREAVANLWPLLCSLGEIAAIVLVGNLLLGFRAAVLAGLVLGTLPLHVHYAGRIMADAPLALFMTLSFLLFWLGQRGGRAWLFFTAGLAAGAVFWIKESTVLYLAVFVSYPLIFRCWNWKWLWMVAGFGLIVAGNLLFFWHIAGNPFHALNSAASSVSAYQGDGAAFSRTIDAPWFYLEYLLLKAYHTGMLGFLALGGVLAWYRVKAFSPPAPGGVGFVVWWASGMLLLFSLLPVSLDPVKLIFKQVNYMLIFTGPLALLAGYFMASMRRKTLAAVVLLVLGSGIVLSALERNVVVVFTANSKAAVRFALEHPDAQVYGPAGAQRAAIFHTLTHPEQPALRIAQSMALLVENGGNPTAKRFVIIDTHTAGWANEGSMGLDRVPPCWQPEGTLPPETDLSLPGLFRITHSVAAQFLPASLRDRVMRAIDQLTEPKSAYVYELLESSCI